MFAIRERLYLRIMPPAPMACLLLHAPEYVWKNSVGPNNLNFGYRLWLILKIRKNVGKSLSHPVGVFSMLPNPSECNKQQK
jgi:hypothetical protein